MRYLPFFIVSIFVLLSGPLVALAAAPSASGDKTGRDGGIEWRQVQEWKTEGRPLDIAHSLDGRLFYILNDQKQVLVYNGNGKLLGKVAVGDGVNAIDIQPYGDTLYLANKKTGTFTTLAVDFIINNIDISGAPSKGPANAAVTIIVFTDFQCPYCIQLEPLLNEVFEKNKDRVKMVFKNFPLPMHPMANPAHRAAWAAGHQGKFWEFHDRLFKSPQLNNETIESIAKDLSLDMDQFKADMASAAAKERVAKDIADGEDAQVTGTPTVFINGRKPQQRTLESYQRMIDDELAKSGK